MFQNGDHTLNRIFKPTHQTPYKNLLVSGCSFTFNNSKTDSCSWPYYLRDLVNFETVYNVAQSGAGTTHIFNSIVNEIETNKNIDPDNTQVIVMWSGLTRTDTIATRDITRPWHHMSNYDFNNHFATLSIFNEVDGKTDLDNLCKQYKLLVDSDAQIYESLLKIVALDGYIKSKRFDYLFTSWQDPTPELDRIKSPMINTVKNLVSSVDYLGEFARKNQLLEPDSGHPSPNGYLEWTKQCLIPSLKVPS